MSASKSFLRVYDTLPPDAQYLLVQRHLAPLLDTAPKERQKRASASATDLRRRYARMPALNLKAKKAEIAGLLAELSRDAKRSLIRERSRREELLSEAVDTIAHWLNDIWRVAFEFRTNFRVAHACLLFACDALDQIGDKCGGCKCSYANMFVPVRITRSTGKLVKSFALNGAHNLESVMLWIWRDLFVTVLATGSKRQRSVVPDMLDDIRVLLGWRALAHLLRGGDKHILSDDSDDDSDDDLEQSDDDLDLVDDDGDQNYLSDHCSTARDEEMYPRSLHARHWSWRITDQQSRLRDLVHAALLDIFKVAPSAPLYTTMASIAEDEDELTEELHPLLMSVAGHSSENLSTALRILCLNDNTDSIYELLEAHQHLLQPKHAASLQFAVLIMSGDFYYRKHAMSIIEQELLDVANVFRAAIRFCFCNIDSELNKSELKQILALRGDSLTRRTRVERWVKGVLTPQAEMTHPMALAALMIGLPLPPGTEGTDNGDMLGYFEVDGDDPEFEELRDEFRPNIKIRLQGWVDTAIAIKGGPAVLSKVYVKIVGEMPFLSGSDVVDEMSSRIVDRPSKVHVCDALEAFRDFCQKQSQKLATGKGKAARSQKAAATANDTSRAVQPEPGSTSAAPS